MKSALFSRFPLVTATLCASLWGAAWGGAARADDFAPIAANDPIYGQLFVLSRAAGEAKKETSLTRYEAALRTARTIFLLTEDSSAATQFPREGWKALSSLIAQLKPELNKMDVETAPILALANRALQAPQSPANAPKNSVALPEPAPARPLRTGAPTPRSTAPVSQERAVAPVPGARSVGLPSPLLMRGGSLAARLAGQSAPLHSNALSVPLSQRLRLETALLSLQREARDPFGDSAPSRLAIASPLRAQTVRATGALSYNVNSWLSARANYEKRDPSVVDPRFSNLSDSALGGGIVRAAGGGLEIEVGENLRFTTNIESLAAQTGERGTKVGGGVGLSAWQNRLSLSAHLSRLMPEDSSALASTAAELNVGVDVTRRLSLNLLYQGLFSEQTVNNASRVGGGISLSF